VGKGGDITKGKSPVKKKEFMVASMQFWTTRKETGWKGSMRQIRIERFGASLNHRYWLSRSVSGPDLIVGGTEVRNVIWPKER